MKKKKVKKVKDPNARKPLTKGQFLTKMGELCDMKRNEVENFMENFVNVAYEEAPYGFVIQGLGKLILKDRPARMARNPRTGGQVQVAAKKVLKFRVAKAARDVLSPKAPKTVEKKKKNNVVVKNTLLNGDVAQS